MSKSTLEATATIIATVLVSEPDSYGKAQADQAVAMATKMLASGEIDAATFGEVVPRVAGNHSAIRQKLVSYGLLAGKEADSAEKRAILAEMKRINDERDAELAKK